jgi:hypothetical protein
MTAHTVVPPRTSSSWSVVGAVKGNDYPLLEATAQLVVS